MHQVVIPCRHEFPQRRRCPRIIHRPKNRARPGQIIHTIKIPLQLLGMSSQPTGRRIHPPAQRTEMPPKRRVKSEQTHGNCSENQKTRHSQNATSTQGYGSEGKVAPHTINGQFISSTLVTLLHHSFTAIRNARRSGHGLLSMLNDGDRRGQEKASIRKRNGNGNRQNDRRGTILRSGQVA